MSAGLTLGQRIREIRLRKKMTQSDVVGEYMTRNMLSKIEHGSAAPSVKTLEFLADSLDVPVGYLLEDSEGSIANAEQLGIIEDLALDLCNYDKSLKVWSVCVRARIRLATGRAEEALKLMLGAEVKGLSETERNHVYMALEDCYRETGNFKMAYDCALKRMGDS